MTLLDAWVGRHDEMTERISPVPLRLLEATLDIAPTGAEDGDPVPPMWHWLYFLPDARQSELGPDGHPRRGLFFPDISMRRRMFAGGKVTIHRPLRVGEIATMNREIAAVDEKQGSTGPLVLVEVRHEISGANGPAITEHQTIVYTDSSPEQSSVKGVPPPAYWERDIATDPTLLFRFSALTFNSHRIHYDRPYAVTEERYPDLVVQGPLILILLTEMARQNGFDLSTVSFRAKSPFFCGNVVHLRGNVREGTANLKAYRASHVALEADIS